MLLLSIFHLIAIIPFTLNDPDKSYQTTQFPTSSYKSLSTSEMNAQPALEVPANFPERDLETDPQSQLMKDEPNLDSFSDPEEQGTSSKRKFSRMPWNITDIITEGYDARLRPNFGMDSSPVMVEIDIRVASVDRISEVNMDYTLTIYLRQYWTDSRLAYSHVLEGVEMLPVDGRITDKLWLPDTYFTNDKDSYLQDITVKNRMLRIKPGGQIIYGLRLSVTASCVFELKKFPHDKQNCSLNLESYGYNTKDIRLKWAPICVTGFGDVELPQFRVVGWNCTKLIASFSSGSYDRLYLMFYLERSVGYFVFQTYMPCIMVVCMSWVSFWINYESSPARVALGITTVLTMTTIFTSARASLPRFSYVKAIDIYLLTCFVFVFASLIEYAIVNYNFWKIKHRLNKTVKNNPNAPETLPHSVAYSPVQPGRKIRANNDSDVLSADELIALRLSTQTSAINSNSPDLPRKTFSSKSPSPNSLAMRKNNPRSRTLTYDSSGAAARRNPSPDELNSPSMERVKASAVQSFAKGYVHAFRVPGPRSDVQRSPQLSSLAVRGPHDATSMQITSGSPFFTGQHGGERKVQPYLTANGSLIKRRATPHVIAQDSLNPCSASTTPHGAQMSLSSHPRLHKVVYKPTLMVHTPSLVTEPNFISSYSPNSESDAMYSNSQGRFPHPFYHNTYAHSPVLTHYSLPGSPRQTRKGETRGSLKESLARFLCKLWPSKIEIPSGERVIIIDRYSRCLFPTAFIIFNAVYWWYYVS